MRHSLAILFSGFMTLLFTSIGPTSTTAADDDNQAFAGSWSQFSGGGWNHWDNNRCQSMASIVRRYELQPVPGSPRKLVGTYFAETAITMLLTNNHSCVVEGFKQFKPSYESQRSWSVDGTVVPGGKVQIRAAFERCLGEACNLPGLNTRNFETTLRAALDRRLIDSPDGAPQAELLRFARTEDLQRQAAVVAERVPALVEPLARGDLDAYYERSLADMVHPLVSKAQLKEGLDKLRTLILSKLEARRLVRSDYGIAKGTKEEPADYVVVINALRLRDGSGAQEIGFLIQEGNAWKVYRLDYDCCTIGERAR